MASKSNVVFVPNLIVEYPHKGLATTPPTDNADPDHDSCSVVNGPELNGVSDERNSGRAGDNHPMPNPNPKTITFTDKIGKTHCEK